MPPYNPPYRRDPYKPPVPVVAPAATPAAAPRTGFGGLLDRASSFRNENPGLLSTWASTFVAPSMQQGFQATGQHLAAQGNKREIAQYLVDHGYASNIAEAMTLAGNQALLSNTLKDDTLVSNYQSKIKILNDMKIDPMSPQGQKYLLGGAGGLGGGGETWSKTINYGVKDGKNIAYITSDAGEVKILDIPGIELSPPGSTIRETDTEFVVLDRNGREIGRYSRNRGQGARLDELYKLRASTENDYRLMVAGWDNLEASVERLGELANEATYNIAQGGWDELRRQMDLDPTVGAKARAAYESLAATMSAGILKDTLGTQFTQADREWFIGMLGDLNKSPQEKQAQLQDYINWRKRDIAAKYEELSTAISEDPTVVPPPPGEDDDGGDDEDALTIPPDGTKSADGTAIVRNRQWVTIGDD
jgi:hypothetical protein